MYLHNSYTTSSYGRYTIETNNNNNNNNKKGTQMNSRSTKRRNSRNTGYGHVHVCVYKNDKM